MEFQPPAAVLTAVVLMIICSTAESVRLVDGDGFCSGRLELKNHHSWSTVCETDFDWQDAEVVCRELGCGTPLTLQGALFGEGKLSFGTREFQCKGKEEHLLTCSTSSREEHTCTHGKAVGLTCTGPNDVRLVDGSSRCAGTMEMFYGGKWMKVGVEKWSINEAAVVCRQLSCGSSFAVARGDNIVKHMEHVVEITCKKSESALRECKIANDIRLLFQSRVFCSESVRLVNGNGFCSGRLEVSNHQSWSTVCETDFDRQDAEVVCRELGCGTPLTLQGALFGEGTHPFGTKEFQCKGTEEHLLTCSTSSKEEHTCKHGNAVGLTCTGPDNVRLVNGSSRCDGIGEVLFKGSWSGILEHGMMYMKTATVVCRQLGCGFAVAATRRKSERKTAVWIACRGPESVLSECFTFRETSELYTLGVVCSDLLQQPTISFSTPIRVHRHRILQLFEVFRGHSFSITCSIESTYPGGSFHLKLPWTNRSPTQTAVNHSASFLFPAADDSQQGNYSCVYENQITFGNTTIKQHNKLIDGSFTPLNFSSESEPLFITVTDSPLPAVIIRILLILFLLLGSCLMIFVIFKKCGHIFIGNSTSGEAAVRFENIQLDMVERRSGEEQDEEEET